MDQHNFEQQTWDILCCFFDEPLLETDGPSDLDSMKIALQLRQLGDHYDETIIQPLMLQVQGASTSTSQTAAAFTNSVDFLCDKWMLDQPEVAPEKHLFKATLALSLYTYRNCPTLKTHVQDAVAYIFTNRLGNWIKQQGGWERVSSICE